MEILTYLGIEVKTVIKLNLNLLQVHPFLGVRQISASVKHTLSHISVGLSDIKTFVSV